MSSAGYRRPSLTDVAWLIAASNYGAEAGAAAATCRSLWTSTQLWGAGTAPRAVDALYGPRGRTRLMYAAATGQLHRLHELVEFGADVNLVGGGGCTPLAAALEGGHAPSVVPVLRALGAREPGFSGTQSFTCSVPSAEMGDACIIASLPGDRLVSAHCNFPSSCVNVWAATGSAAGTLLASLPLEGPVEALAVLLGGGSRVATAWRPPVEYLPEEGAAEGASDDELDAPAVLIAVWDVDTRTLSPPLLRIDQRRGEGAICLLGMPDGRLVVGDARSLHCISPSEPSAAAGAAVVDFLTGPAIAFAPITALAWIPSLGGLVAAGNARGQFLLVDPTGVAPPRLLDARQNRPVRALVALPGAHARLVSGGGGAVPVGGGRFRFGMLITVVDAASGALVVQTAGGPAIAGSLIALPNGVVLGTCSNTEVVGQGGIFGFDAAAVEGRLVFKSLASEDLRSIPAFSSAAAAAAAAAAPNQSHSKTHIASSASVLDNYGPGLFRVAVAVHACDTESFSAGLSAHDTVCIRVYR